MTKMVKVLVLVAILTATLAVSPAQACACGAPDWSRMSSNQVVSTINAMEAQPRVMEGERGLLPTPPPGYQYDSTYELVPITPTR
jgi:hypothetical protein